MKEIRSYNKRLFSWNIIRKSFHYSRFNWLKKTLKKYSIEYSNVLEIGCFDGKLLDYLPYPPKKYIGFDADWEGGLGLAQEKYGHLDNIAFSFVLNPDEMKLKEDEFFNLAVCMETFEHIPPTLVCPYLEKVSKHLNGYFLITVPNEKGPFFILKRILKPKNKKEENSYAFSIWDLINLTFGRTNRVIRKEHKGFDYDHLIYDIRKYFDIVSVQGYSIFRFIPLFLSIGVGIVAVPKNHKLQNNQ